MSIRFRTVCCIVFFITRLGCGANMISHRCVFTSTRVLRMGLFRDVLTSTLVEKREAMQEKVASLFARCLPVHRIVQARGVKLDSHCGRTGLGDRRQEKKGVWVGFTQFLIDAVDE